MLSATLYEMTGHYQLGIGGRAAAWPAGIAIAGLLGLLIFPVAGGVVYRVLKPDTRLSFSPVPASGTGQRIPDRSGRCLHCVGLSRLPPAVFRRRRGHRQRAYTFLSPPPVGHGKGIGDAQRCRRGQSPVGVSSGRDMCSRALRMDAPVVFELPHRRSVRVRELAVALYGGMAILYVAASASFYLIGTFKRRWRPLAVTFGRLLGAGTLSIAPLAIIFLGLVSVDQFSCIE